MFDAGAFQTRLRKTFLQDEIFLLKCSKIMIATRNSSARRLSEECNQDLCFPQEGGR